MGQRRRISGIARAALLSATGLLLGLGLVGVGAGSGAISSAQSGPQVLYVGTFNGVTTPPSQTFSTIQAAVNASSSGDWILIAPGDYHASADAGITAPNNDTSEGWYGGVLVTTSNIHLRGMNRNSVIVDGTLPGSPTCSSNPADQNFLNGLGRNGIVVWANNVDIDNLTVCNFQAGSGNSGNEIWWNGGNSDSTHVAPGDSGYEGSYLTATSTYFANSDGSNASVCDTCALYGLFSSNAAGGSWTNVFANNFADSGAYIGACQQFCDATVKDATFDDNALGYSGTDSGGRIQIEHSTFSNNKEGLDTNTALTGDPPPPQNGECPNDQKVKGSVAIPGTNPKVYSCWVFGPDNLVENNNNPNVPVEGTAGLGPTGTGMTISGGRNDTVEKNKFLDNGAWGMLFVPYPDGNLTSDGRTCTGIGGVDVTSLDISGVSCILDPMGDYSHNNEFSGNGTDGNASNADVGNLLITGGEPEDCAKSNSEYNSSFTAKTGPASVADSDSISSKCGADNAVAKLLGTDTDLTLLLQAECDAGLFSPSSPECTSATYPQATAVTMEPLPGASGLQSPQTTDLASMHNPCKGAPSNLWCPHGKPASGPAHHAHHRVTKKH